MTKRDLLQLGLLILMSVILAHIVDDVLGLHKSADYHIYPHVDATQIVRSDTLGILDLYLPYRGKREDTMMVEIKLCKIRDTCQWFFKCFVMMPRDTAKIGAEDVSIGQIP